MPLVGCGRKSLLQMADCGACTKQRGTYIPDFINAPPNQMAQKSDEIKKKRKH